MSSGLVFEDLGASNVTNALDVEGSVRFQSRVSFWRRLWVVASAVPRYLITGTVEIP